LNSVKDTLLNRIHSVYFFLFILFPVLSFLAFNRHHKDDYKSYHSVIFADAAGYYVYLPYWFIYGNNIESYPDSIVQHTGDGFRLDKSSQIIYTKYTCGVAMLQMPFFIAAHLLAKPLGFSPNGFSKPYHWAIFIAASFYCALGLFFLNKLLRKYFSSWVSVATSLSLLLCTNLYYYTVTSGGMAHAYSFFLISVLFYAADVFYQNPNIITLVLLAAVSELALLTRPLNFPILLLVFFYKINSWRQLLVRIRFWITSWRYIIAFAVLGFVIMLPQMLYWHKISGQWIFDSYQNESFIYWNQPKLAKLWFSTNNGLFTYSPFLLLGVIGVSTMYRLEAENRVLFPTIFFITSYVFASWHSWYFGCAYGARAFVDYLPLFAFPIAYSLQGAQNSFRKYIIAAFIIICLSINFDIIYYYSSCFTYGDWNWKSYLDLFKD